jgi:undecaprenyl-diphosphatase
LEPSGGLAFVVFTHFATVLAVLTVFRARVAFVLGGTWSGLKSLASRQWPVGEEGFFWALYIVAGSVPAAAVGLTFKDQIETAFSSPMFASAMLLITGAILWGTGRKSETLGTLSPFRAILIGLAQAAAILPGISRSGSTIAAGIYLGVEREKAADFSFLLAVPVIAGSTVLEAVLLFDHPPTSEALAAIGAGMVVSYGVGLAAILVLLKMVRRGRLSWFAYYCWAVSISALALL